MKRWREYFVTIGIAIVCALLVRHFLFTAYKVPTGSMQPTLLPGDFIFSSRISYGITVPLLRFKIFCSQPDRGDLVVFNYPDRPAVTYVKRVVGLPGDRVQMSKGRLFINEQPLNYELVKAVRNENPNRDLFDLYDESFGENHWRVLVSKEKNEREFSPFIVPPDELFLLGDNRDASDDSRYWGTVPTSSLIGRVQLIWLSLDWNRKWGGNRYPSVRWERVFSSVY